MYQIKFPIGDWSGDGHGKCEWFILQSNKTVQEVRNIHLRSKEKLGFSIGEICSDYYDWFLGETISEYLLINNVLIPTEIDRINSDGLSSSDIIDIWIKCLMRIEPSLILKVIPETVIPSIVSCSDVKPISTPGYGLFE